MLGKVQFFGYLLVGQSVTLRQKEAFPAHFRERIHGGPKAGFQGGSFRRLVIGNGSVQVHGQRFRLPGPPERVDATVPDGRIQPRLHALNRFLLLPKRRKTLLDNIFCRIRIT